MFSLQSSLFRLAILFLTLAILSEASCLASFSLSSLSFLVQARIAQSSWLHAPKKLFEHAVLLMTSLQLSYDDIALLSMKVFIERSMHPGLNCSYTLL